MHPMTAVERTEITETLLVLAVQVLLPFALFAWGRRVAARRLTRTARIASWLPLIGLGVLPLGVLTCIVLVVLGLASADDDDAATRATVLARSISTGMNLTAVGVALAFAVYLGCAFGFAYATWGPQRR